MKQLFEVQGMSCNHCVKAVTQAIRKLDPEAEVNVTLEQGRVEVQSAAAREALAEAIREEGYTVAA